jgi:uncharacterized protein YciI
MRVIHCLGHTVFDTVTEFMAKQHFYVRLIPPRPTFASDMNADERVVMQQHGVYFRGLFDQGKVLVFGPVLDPTDNFGMAVLEVADISEAQQVMEHDPTVVAGMNRFRISPMVVGAARAKEEG